MKNIIYTLLFLFSFNYNIKAQSTCEWIKYDDLPISSLHINKSGTSKIGLYVLKTIWDNKLNI